MTTPCNPLETRAAMPVNPKHRKAIAYTVETFDQVQKLVEKPDQSQKKEKNEVEQFKFKQMYDDLPAVNKDIETFVKLAKQFRFKRDDIIVFK